MPDHELTDEDRQKAAKSRDENEHARMELKQALHDGNMTLFDALLQGSRSSEHDIRAGRLTVHEVLMALPNVDDVRTQIILTQAGVAGDRHLNSLTEAERVALAAEAAPFATLRDNRQ